jgi:hypothetical protein
MKLLRIGLLFFMSSISVHAESYHDATAQHYGFYLCAQYSQLQPQSSQLTQKYYAQLAVLRAPVFSLAGYLEHLFQLQHYSTIVRLIPELGDSFNDNKDIQIIIGQTLELVGKPYDAETIFINLYPSCKNQPDVCYYAAAAQARRNNFTQALAIVDDYLNNTTQRPNHFMFYFLKSKIFQSLNQQKEAAESLQQGMSLYKTIQGVSYDQNFINTFDTNSLHCCWTFRRTHLACSQPCA